VTVADASIARVIAHIRVRRTQNAGRQDFEYAGIETYAKRDGRWAETTESGTFKINEDTD
jgi:hypothetical protein